MAHNKFHVTRHSYASLLIDKNVNLGYISKQMGHTSVAMTAGIYGHLLPDRDKPPIDVLDPTRAPVAPNQK
jgi:integrase